MIRWVPSAPMAAAALAGLLALSAPWSSVLAADGATIANPVTTTIKPITDEDKGARADLATDPALYLQLIAKLQDKGLYFASLAHLDAFDRRWPGEKKAVLLRADALRETGYVNKASLLYESLMKSPYEAGAQHGLGLIASKQGDFNAALQALNRAAELDPTNAVVLNDLGYVQLLTSQMADAGFNLHKATELDPQDTRAGANLALYYVLDNKQSRAEGIMDWYRLSENQRKEIKDKADALKGRNSP
ncbi:tetratricopeptide repeat protein [Parasulfuritortus cantonensis]|uniref:Tetratricopeptide repeat protein n=1 Tax=Parasulfuritortus cantonensis TaxID=2528202 RepID=A0A4R1BKU0_9PROT|nr:tetratricopeptide repeat protein [Parasulfuritortus cantonensis]TCJ17973.1 tetratricopeptide repeat protein [Parasulfuritortus cantonensis]